MPTNARQRDLLRHLWIEGPLSRWELHERTGMTPNGVGTVAQSLLGSGVLRERPAEPSGGGRPRTPLEIDPGTRHVVGLSIAPGRVEAARVGLRGHLLGAPATCTVEEPGKLVGAASDVLAKVLNRQSLAIGMSVTGFVDPDGAEILFSSSTPGMGSVSLRRLFEQASLVPVLLGNDMHATAARWMLTHRAHEGEDVLMVGLDDGAVGATVLVSGRPNKGCVTGANELGHCRFFVETAPCYCGQTGCLERICSSDFLIRNGAPAGTTLADYVSRLNGKPDEPVEAVIKYLAMGLANATNFIRPSRLVLVSRLVRHARFADLLVRSIRSLLLTELADRVGVDLWDQPAVNTAETAGWLGLAAMFYEGWTSRIVVL